MSIDTLKKAQKNKNDEFYTQLSDIEKEMKHYKEHFKGKVVYCNCDDPYESNFFKYFALNFNQLGLKKLISVSYAHSSVAGEEMSLFQNEGVEYKITGKRAYKVVMSELKDVTGDGRQDLNDVKEIIKHRIRYLKGDGDFRSKESIELMKEADIICTNPPFSLFREFVAQLIDHDKKFIIIGNQNAITYKEFFPLIKEGKVWLGYKFGDMAFKVPSYYEPRETRYWQDDTGQKWRSLGNACWYTNLDIKKRHNKLDLYKQYNPEEYPKYDNYDAIEVSRTADIPYDYEGVMGVPITFMDKYSPDQFEIVGLAPERLSENEASLQIKRYVNAVQHKANGTSCSGNKVNDGPVIIHDRIPKYPYYTSETVPNKFLEVLYARILIRRKKAEADED